MMEVLYAMLMTVLCDTSTVKSGLIYMYFGNLNKLYTVDPTKSLAIHGGFIIHNK